MLAFLLGARERRKMRQVRVLGLEEKNGARDWGAIEVGIEKRKSVE